MELIKNFESYICPLLTGCAILEPLQSHWYVARLVAGETDRALASLERERFNYSYPLGHVADGTSYPLLPGYVLVQCPAHRDYWSLISNLAGIERLLPVGAESPSFISPREFDEFHSRINAGEYEEGPRVEPPLPWFKKGEVVFIHAGPFANHTGLFKFVKRGRVVLDVAIFGATLEVAFSGHQVSKSN